MTRSRLRITNTSLEPGFVLQERIAGPEVRNRDSQMRAHLGLNQVAHRPVSSAFYEDEGIINRPKNFGQLLRGGNDV